jgi:hypothetical protein
MMERRLFLVVCACVLLAQVEIFAAVSAPPEEPVRRTVLALYDSRSAETPRFTMVHALAEMPLNHLGLIVRYHDISTGLPPVESLADARGVLTWFSSDSMDDPIGYLQWIEEVVRSGRSFVVVGSLGVSRDSHGVATPPEEINRVLSILGWRDDGGWHTTTYGASYRIRDDRLIGFERPLPVAVPPYATVRATAPDARVALQVALDGRPSATSDLVIISPRGAYVAPGFSCFVEFVEGEEFRQWYLDPFEFFREAFQTDEIPKLDTATLSGRRIYYSHLDGDGWRNLTQVEPYRSSYATSARVVLEEVVRKYPEFPVSIAVVVGDIDRRWHGSTESLDVAREIYAEPQVEASIHTYSHPFTWSAFDAEAPATTGSRAAEVRTAPRGDVTHADLDDARTYDVEPFSLTLEIDDAAAFVNALLPAGREVTLLQWTGDTLPFERAIAHGRERGLANINGGDTRFDREFPSAAWVAPLGSRVGGELQVYASNSNENTYTDLWQDRFFGFSFLTTTVRNTGSPRRLKPFNLYYHMYSGERLSSLNAVLENLRYARSLRLTPIETSRFSRIVEGFFSATIERTGDRVWRVRDRGALQTLRFDNAALDGVDFNRSRGVIGQRHELGSLFVALDEAEPDPVVALKRIRSASREPHENVAYLVESRWRVFDVRQEPGEVRFATAGFGPGESTWQWPFGSRVRVRWQTASGRAGEFDVTADELDQVRLRLPQLTGERVAVTIDAAEDGGDGR